MYKGSKKTVLVFKSRDGGMFDEAHFIVKEDLDAKEEDIVKEANRIICEYGSYKARDKKIKKGKSGTFWYIWGLFSGFGAFALCLVLSQLLV